MFKNKNNNMFKKLFNNLEKKGKVMAIKLVAMMIIIVIFSLIFYYCYGNKKNWIINNKKKDEKISLSDMIYFSTVTNLTIGFGDIIPITYPVKYLVIFKILLTSGILLL